MSQSTQFSFKTFGIHASALIETLLSACATLLIHQPYGLFSLKSCAVEQLSDWYVKLCKYLLIGHKLCISCCNRYTVLHNPNPNYEEVLHCAQEAVYPLYAAFESHLKLVA